MDGRWHLGLGIISAVLQLIAYVSPGWLMFTEWEKEYNMGLWYKCIPSCVAYESHPYGFVYDSAFPILVYMNSGYWLEFQEPKMFKAYALVFFVIAGVTLWVPAGTFANFYATWTASQLPRISFPYAVVLAGIAASISLLLTFLLLIDLCMKQKKPQQTQIMRSPQPYIVQHERMYDSYSKGTYSDDVYLHRSPYLGPYITRQ
ncbi:hypothetical protein ScPMuIL_004992 [Solemya velum]